MAGDRPGSSRPWWERRVCWPGKTRAVASGARGSLGCDGHARPRRLGQGVGWRRLAGALVPAEAASTPRSSVVRSFPGSLMRGWSLNPRLSGRLGLEWSDFPMTRSKARKRTYPDADAVAVARPLHVPVGGADSSSHCGALGCGPAGGRHRALEHEGQAGHSVTSAAPPTVGPSGGDPGPATHLAFFQGLEGRHVPRHWRPGRRGNPPRRPPARGGVSREPRVLPPPCSLPGAGIQSLPGRHRKLAWCRQILLCLMKIVR